MRSDPRFKSRTTREIAVAVAMFILFSGSLAGAYALTAARSGSNPYATGPATGLTIQVMGLELTIPANWRRAPAVEERVQERTQTKSLVVMSDPQRPTRSLAIISARMDVSPEDALERALGVLVPEDLLQTLRHVTPNPHGFHLSTLIGRQYIGYSQPAADQPASVYVIAVLTRDGQNYWVLMLNDQSDAPDEASVAAAVKADVAVFQNVLNSTELQVPSAASPGKDSS